MQRIEQGEIIFTGNVVARYATSTQYADRMRLILADGDQAIERAVLTGNVRIVTRDGWIATALRGEYKEHEGRVVLHCGARAWHGKELVTGDSITIHLWPNGSALLVEDWREPQCPAAGSALTARR
jgi:lipopolysaccharide transport protein LptA